MFFKDQGQPVLISNSRKVLGAQGHLPTLASVGRIEAKVWPPFAMKIISICSADMH